MGNVEHSMVPLVTVSERFGKDVGAHVIGGTILDGHVIVPKNLMGKGEVHPVRPAHVAKSGALAGPEHLDGRFVVLHEAELHGSSEEFLPQHPSWEAV
jgi:hypothetical protein